MIQNLIDERKQRLNEISAPTIMNEFMTPFYFNPAIIDISEARLDNDLTDDACLELFDEYDN